MYGSERDSGESEHADGILAGVTRMIFPSHVISPVHIFAQMIIILIIILIIIIDHKLRILRALLLPLYFITLYLFIPPCLLCCVMFSDVYRLREGYIHLHLLQLVIIRAQRDDSVTMRSSSVKILSKVT